MIYFDGCQKKESVCFSGPCLVDSNYNWIACFPTTRIIDKSSTFLYICNVYIVLSKAFGLFIKHSGNSKNQQLYREQTRKERVHMILF